MTDPLYIECSLFIIATSRYVQVVSSHQRIKHFVAIFKKSDIDISGCGISILDGSVIADFKFISFIIANQEVRA